MRDLEGTELLEIAERAVNIGHRLGLRQVEAFSVMNRVFTVRMTRNSIFEAKGVLDKGVGIRVSRECGLGFSSTSKFDSESLSAAAANASRIASKRSLGVTLRFPEISPCRGVGGIYDEALAKTGPDEIVALAQRTIQSSTESGSNIIDNSGALTVVEFTVAVSNSNGLSESYRGTMFEHSLTATARDGELTSEGAASTAGRTLKGIRPEDVGRKAADMASEGLKASGLEERTYSVVLDPTAVSDIAMHVSILTSPLYIKTYSPLYVGKVGQLVSSLELSVVDDPTEEGGVGSAPIDDEGTPTVKRYIIDHGRLETFAYDTLSGLMESRASTGNAVRAVTSAGISALPGKNYNCEPIPILLNPVVEPGGCTRQEMIEDTRDGLLVERLHYTRLTNPSRGDYTAVLRMGLSRIKDGSVVGSVKKARIVDNLVQMMMSVDAVGKELTVAGDWGAYSHVPSLRTKARIVPIR
jgi:PmbA protein